MVYYTALAITSKSIFTGALHPTQKLSAKMVLLMTLPIFCAVCLNGYFLIEVLKLEFINRELSILDYFKVLLLVPVLEELVFRGVFFQKLHKLYPNRSIVIVSLGFAIGHTFTDSGLLIVFLFSLYLTWIYLKIQNIYLVMFLHMLTNCLGLLEIFYTYPNNNYAVLAIVLLAVAGVGYISISKVFKIIATKKTIAK